MFSKQNSCLFVFAIQSTTRSFVRLLTALVHTVSRLYVNYMFFYTQIWKYGCQEQRRYGEIIRYGQLAHVVFSEFKAYLGVINTAPSRLTGLSST